MVPLLTNDPEAKAVNWIRPVNHFRASGSPFTPGGGERWARCSSLLGRQPADRYVSEPSHNAPRRYGPMCRKLFNYSGGGEGAGK